MQNKGNILLTGVSGFIGGHVAARLLQEGYEVYAPVRTPSKEKIRLLLQHKNLIFLEGDFYNPGILQTLQNKKIDAILHFASIRGAGNGRADEYEKINVTGTQVLLDFALQNKIPNFLYCSTVGVLGTIPQRQPASTDSPEAPDGIYHQTKWQAEERVREYSKKGLNTIILRPTITYGSGDDGFIPKLVSLISRGRFPLSSKPFSIHLLHVQAFSRLVNNVIEKKYFNNKTYIIADAHPVLLKDLTEQIVREVKGCYYKIPSVVFSLVSGLLNLLSLNGLHTSVQLISAPWTYDISETILDLSYVPDETAESISNYIKEYV